MFIATVRSLCMDGYMADTTFHRMYLYFEFRVLHMCCMSWGNTAQSHYWSYRRHRRRCCRSVLVWIWLSSSAPSWFVVALWTSTRKLTTFIIARNWALRTSLKWVFGNLVHSYWEWKLYIWCISMAQTEAVISGTRHRLCRTDYSNTANHFDDCASALPMIPAVGWTVHT